jgi:radical SAM protein with 4Fe4S-binding SPASM domain
MLRRDLFQILESVRERDFSFILFTSGTRVTSEIADRLRDLYPQRVEISLLGGQPATHDRITRVKGSFAKALTAVRLLRAREIQVQIKTTWMRDNIEEANHIRSLARDLGATFRSAFLLIHRRDGSAEPENLSVTEEQLRAMALNDLSQAGAKTVPPPPTPLTERQKGALSPCGAGQTSCRIDAFGLVYPCAAIDTILGDIRRAPFAHIWRANPMMANLRAIRVSHLTECSSCRLFLRCSRCAGLARMETGSLLSPSRQSCKVARALEGFYEEQRCELQ